MEICTNYKGLDLVLVITDYDYTAGRPAQVTGPPEYCYPEEPAELEINDGYVYLDGEQYVGTIKVKCNTELKFNKLFDKVVANDATIPEKTEELVCDDLENEAEARAEAEYEARRDDELAKEGFWG